ncbi:hypothetical protein V6R90_19180, partial [Nocardioides kribbensis]
ALPAEPRADYRQRVSSEPPLNPARDTLLQTDVLNQRRWATRQDLRLAIVVGIERTYHRQRPQDVLDGLTPIEYEHKITAKTATAA